jgi:hypothetical protein
MLNIFDLAEEFLLSQNPERHRRIDNGLHLGGIWSHLDYNLYFYILFA